MSHICKRIFRFKLQLSSYWQNIKFSRNCPKFHIFTLIVIFQVYYSNFLDKLLHPYKFHDRYMSGILFFIFPSCEPLIQLIPFYLANIHKQYPIYIIGYINKFVRQDKSMGIYSKLLRQVTPSSRHDLKDTPTLTLTCSDQCHRS